MKTISIQTILFFLVVATHAYADPQAGKSLFNGSAKCKNCHKTSAKKKVGPGLAGVTKRAPEEWIRSWLTNAQEVWSADEGYAQTLKKTLKREKKPKTRHKTRKLTEQEISDLLDFLKTLQ